MGIRRVAVAGKFSNRNDRHEMLVKEHDPGALSPHGCMHQQRDFRTPQFSPPRRDLLLHGHDHEGMERFADAIEAAVSARAPGLRSSHPEGRRRHHAARGEPEKTVRDGVFRARGEHHGRRGPDAGNP